MNEKAGSPVTKRPHFTTAISALSAAAATVEFPFITTVHAKPDDPIKIGLIGCGGRGTGAALDALGAATNVIYPKAGYHTEDVAQNAQTTEKNVAIVALADVFPDRLERCRAQLKKLNMEVPPDQCFTGFDAYKQLLAVPEVNYVILGTPPHFHPIHMDAAIKAGKNVFMEKPAAVDAPGVHLVIEAGKLAKEKGLGIAAGSQRRHMLSYPETIKRIHDGAIGEILYCRAYWNGGVIWVIRKEPAWSEMEWQLRNWNYFTWLGGDHIVEQHVHNIDIINWVMGRPPVKATALGGRQARPNKDFGHIYDHFAVEFEYENGARFFSQCRQMDGCADMVAEAAVGTKGTSNCQNRIEVKGGESWRFPGKDPNPYRQEHLDLINSIRAGQPINEAQNIAMSTMLGIMGREAAYSGKVIQWETAFNSKTSLSPAKYEFGDIPFPEVAMPGKYKPI